MKCEYMMLLGAILAVPLLRCGDRNLPFRRNPGTMVKTLAIICPPFWCWDILAVHREHWMFNPDYILGVSAFGLPVEEWLFFPVIGFVSMVAWEAAKYLERSH